MMILAMKGTPARTLDPEALRAAMRGWTAGVTIVSATHAGLRHGMTVNSFTSISLDPAWITISLQQATRTHELVLASRLFGVTILSTDQQALSERFAGKAAAGTFAHPADPDDRFAGLEIATLVTGAPLIKGGLAWLDCRLLQSISAGANTLFIAEVVAAQGEFQGEPLIYHHRKYWRLDDL
jgi:flavin reductase (DIM6/NTAB) family NADH-FMN oxidoreductase RutF